MTHLNSFPILYLLHVYRFINVSMMSLLAKTLYSIFYFAYTWVLCLQLLPTDSVMARAATALYFFVSRLLWILKFKILIVLNYRDKNVYIINM
jgi:hypothetical protein